MMFISMTIILIFQTPNHLITDLKIKKYFVSKIAEVTLKHMTPLQLTKIWNIGVGSICTNVSKSSLLYTITK